MWLISDHLLKEIRIFTLQILELERPTVLALNMVNLLKEKREFTINFAKLEEILGIPVVPVAAIYGKGITETLNRGIGLVGEKEKPKPLKYGKEVEERIGELSRILKRY